MNSNTIDAITSEVKRIEEDSLYSARGHFVVSRWSAYGHFALGIPATVTAAMAGISAISENIHLSLMLSIVTAILAGLITFLNPKECHTAHLREGNQYKALSNDSRIFRTVRCQAVTDIDQISKELLVLNDRRNSLNEKSRSIPYWAFKLARKGIEEGEANYQADNPATPDAS